MSDDREAILARRRRFIAWALAGGAAAQASACACLTPLSHDTSTVEDAAMDAGIDAGAMPCLSVDAPPPHDAGTPDGAIEDASMDGGGIDDTGEPFDGGKPLPCLTPPPRDPRE
jgi:hypothetical protein